jgi:hypothetical protein
LKCAIRKYHKLVIRNARTTMVRNVVKLQFKIKLLDYPRISFNPHNPSVAGKDNQDHISLEGK